MTIGRVPQVADETWRFRDKFAQDVADSLRMALMRTALEARHAPTRNCLFCKNFDEANGEVCRRATPPTRPPARVIVAGCKAYDDVDDIPF